MYVIFFMILALFGYGGIFMRGKPLFLIFSIISVSILMLVPFGSDIITSQSIDVTEVLTGTDSSTTLDIEGSEDVVLLSLAGYELTVWVWFHVALLIVYSLMFFFWAMK